ncbi:hypothetical protein C0995_011513 [Termitomyces sp. Mi166|nr:hypothetical protein C0995_011513 [Termitomyces sp. Mi166\
MVVRPLLLLSTTLPILTCSTPRRARIAARLQQEALDQRMVLIGRKNVIPAEYLRPSPVVITSATLDMMQVSQALEVLDVSFASYRLQFLLNSLAEANADKEWLWSVLEDAWADNRKIRAGLEKVQAEKTGIVAECEKIWGLLAHRTVEVKVLQERLAQYEASAEAGEDGEPTMASQ